MPNSQHSFSINGTKLVPIEMDIQELDADIYVAPVGTSPPGKFKTFDRATWVLGDDERKKAILGALDPHLPFRLGDVAVTPAGNLKAKYLIHAAIIDWENSKTLNDLIREEVITDAAGKCIELAVALGVESIAFTPWGPDAVGENASRITAYMLQAIALRLQRNVNNLRTVYLISNNFEHYQWLLDRAFVFHLIYVHIRHLRTEVSQLDLPTHRSRQILTMLDELQDNIVIYNEIVNGDKITVGDIEDSTAVAIGQEAFTKATAIN